MSAFPIAHVTLYQASKVNIFPEHFSRHLFLKVLIVPPFPAHIKGIYRKSSRLTFVLLASKFSMIAVSRLTICNSIALYCLPFYFEKEADGTEHEAPQHLPPQYTEIFPLSLFFSLMSCFIFVKI